MKSPDDLVTLDIFEKLKLPTAKRGRPPVAGALTNAQRQAKHRAKLVDSGLGFLTVELSKECIEFLNAHAQFKGIKKDLVIEKLIRSQLMRKR